jgi:hypothetical protein
MKTINKKVTNMIEKARTVSIDDSSSFIGGIVNGAIIGMFRGSANIPFQTIIGSVISRFNHSDLLHRPVETSTGSITVLDQGMNTDPKTAQLMHKHVVLETLSNATKYIALYGDIDKVLYSGTDKNGKKVYATSHTFKVGYEYIGKVLEYAEKRVFKNNKKVNKISLQKYLPSKLGFEIEVGSLFKEMMELQKNQKVLYVLNEQEAAKAISMQYKQQREMANGHFKLEKTAASELLTQKHLGALMSYNGNQCKVVDTIESRGRAKSMENAIAGYNLYGKEWETQSFRLGYKTVAYDGRQFAYATFGGFFHIIPLLRMTGNYNDCSIEELADIYVDVFLSAINKAFSFNLADIVGSDKEARSIAKRPAQLLMYMAGLPTIINGVESGRDAREYVNNKGEEFLVPNSKKKSILEVVRTKYPDMTEKEAVKLLDLAFRGDEILSIVMEVRDNLTNCEFTNKVAPNWTIDGVGTFFYERVTNEFAEDEGESVKHQIILNSDAGKPFSMDMFAGFINPDAKRNGMLPAVFHCSEHVIIARTQIDVIKAGGKMLKKHDEIIVNKEHEEYMLSRLAYHATDVWSKPKKYIFDPLRQMGYNHSLEKIYQRNKAKFGQIDWSKVKNSRNGFSFEWEIETPELEDQFSDIEYKGFAIENAKLRGDDYKHIEDFILIAEPCEVRDYVVDGTINVKGNEYKTIANAVRYNKS